MVDLPEPRANAVQPIPAMAVFALMLRSIQRFFSYYANYYWDYLVEVWNDMTPMSYGILLVCIGIFGWLLMKSGLKKC